MLFPYALAPLVVGRKSSAAAIETALSGTEPAEVLLCLQRSPEVEQPGFEDLHRVGTIAEVVRKNPLTDGRIKIVVQGLRRVVLTSVHQPKDAEHSLADWEPLRSGDEEPGAGDASEEAAATQARPEFDALVRQIKEDLDRYARAGKASAPELLGLLRELGSEQPERFSDLVASSLHLPLDEAQRLLEETDVEKRLERLSSFLRKELLLLDLQEGIRARTKDVLSRAQREHFLREQLRQIHSELSGDGGDELKELRQRLSQSQLSGEALVEAERQLRRLETLPSASPESQVVRTHLEWLLELPWEVRTEDRFELGAARELLDEEHYDLRTVKRRILEFLSVLRLRQGGPSLPGAVLCFSGPPGVGKTSLGRSIARALGRRFVRVSLGGVRDDAEIRGHRRTYVASMPGRLIQGLRQAGSKNPVMLLDELDKMVSDAHGDPAAALLEVLDPEQNHAFRDHYLSVPFDLSEVLFIATANQLERLPQALRDRLEVIQLSGYTEEEKLCIAQRHLVPRVLADSGLSPRYPVEFTRPALKLLIESYTQEAGVRELQRKLAAVCRKLAHGVVAREEAVRALSEISREGPARSGKSVAKGSAAGQKKTSPAPQLQPMWPPPRRAMIISKAAIARYLGPPTRRPMCEGTLVKAAIGRALGLAWTPSGGEVLEVETQATPGPFGLRLTGQLGEVMKESAHAALSYARAQLAAWGFPDPSESARGRELHIHVPAGAIPKDGPSAGVTIATALISQLTGTPVKDGVAMTGEITLSGRVLPVGGIKEKLLAARRAGIRTVLVPGRNLEDQAERMDLPSSLFRELEVIPVADMVEVLRVALEHAPRPQHTKTHRARGPRAQKTDARPRR